MQNLLMGPSGGGKSYEATVFHILPALNKGRKVITNLPVNVDYFEAICPGASDLLELRSDKGTVRAFSRVNHFGDDWRHPNNGSGPLYVIDECHKAFPRGKTDQLVEEWFAEHRHESADVLLITQSYGKISKAIVDNMQLVYRVRKAVALGSSSHYVRKVQDGIRGEILNETLRTYDSKYFALYKSHTKGGGEELGASDVVPIWKHWSFRGAAIFLTLGIGGMLFLGNPFKVKTPPPVVEEVRQSKVEVVETSAPVEVLVPVAERAEPRGPDAKVHPYQGYTLHLIALVKGLRVLPGADQPDEYLNGYMAVSSNGQRFTTVSFDDLRTTGYQIQYHSNSVVSLTYKGFDVGYIIADVPKIALADKVPGNE